MAYTTDTSFGALKKVCPHLRACEMRPSRPVTADEAMKNSTAFSGLQDALDTQPHYVPKFEISRSLSSEERAQMIYAGKCFNFAAERAGQSRRAIFF